MYPVTPTLSVAVKVGMETVNEVEVDGVLKAVTVGGGVCRRLPVCSSGPPGKSSPGFPLSCQEPVTIGIQGFDGCENRCCLSNNHCRKDFRTVSGGEFTWQRERVVQGRTRSPVTGVEGVQVARNREGDADQQGCSCVDGKNSNNPSSSLTPPRKNKPCPAGKKEPEQTLTITQR